MRTCYSLAFVLLCAPLATAQTFVVPATAATALGGRNQGFPFSYTNYVRFQQIIDTSHFSGPTLLFGMSLRVATPPTLQSAPDPAMQGMIVTLADSTVTAAAATGNFAANVGANAAVVFNGEVRLQKVNGTDAREFNVTFPFSTPYLHTNVNSLLIDLVPTSYMGQACNGGGNGTSFDGAAVPGMATVAGKGSCGAPPTTGGGVGQSAGYVIEFYTSPMVMPYGKACATSQGTLTSLTSVGASQVNSPGFVVRLNGVPPTSSLGAFILGGSNLGSAPVDLAPIGMPTCYLHEDLAVVLPAVVAGGFALQPLPIPNNPVLSGQSVFTQFAIVDPGVNALGLFMSQGGWVFIR